MSSDKRQRDPVTTNRQFPATVRSAIEDSLNMLESVDWIKNDRTDLSVDPLPSLLEQCGKLAHEDSTAEPEPIRTVHHFACTGGTLITKCLACVPNVHVLSEVDPLSPLAGGGGKFAPADILQLAQKSNRVPTSKEKIQLFMGSLAELYRANEEKGLRLLIRDHTHSHFCVGDSIPQRLSLRQMLAERFPVRSMVTVRHPIDSYLALLNHKWLHFQPATVEEYALRYEAFLDKYADAAIFRYEDFTKQPDQTLSRMCAEMTLPVPEGYREIFIVHCLSGDSGRRGTEIKPRARRAVPKSVQVEFQRSHRLRRLTERLGYDWDI